MLQNIKVVQMIEALKKKKKKKKKKNNIYCD